MSCSSTWLQTRFGTRVCFFFSPLHVSLIRKNIRESSIFACDDELQKKKKKKKDAGKLSGNPTAWVWRQEKKRYLSFLCALCAQYLILSQIST